MYKSLLCGWCCIKKKETQRKRKTVTATEPTLLRIGSVLRRVGPEPSDAMILLNLGNNPNSAFSLTPAL